MSVYTFLDKKENDSKERTIKKGIFCVYTRVNCRGGCVFIMFEAIQSQYFPSVVLDRKKQ